MMVWIFEILLLFLFVGSQGIAPPGETTSNHIEGSDKWVVPESDYLESGTSDEQWEVSYAYVDVDVQQPEKATTQELQREPFNESLLSEFQKSKVTAQTTCHETYMTVAIARDEFRRDGIDSLTVVQSACRLHMRMNGTHVIFNQSYEDFSERPCGKVQSGPCCTNLRIMRYEVGVVYRLEVPIDVLQADSNPHLVKILEYCYFETPKRDETPGSHTAIKLYPSMYGEASIGVSGGRLPVASGQIVYLKVESEERLPNTENFPINCWLSPYISRQESSKDMADSLFLKDGCPVHGDALVTTDVNREHRVGFSLTAYKMNRDFLYVHCQYVKCSTAKEEIAAGKLPQCPRFESCTNGSPPKHQYRQLSTASSDVILHKVIKRPEAIHAPVAPRLVADRPCECKGSENGPNAMEADKQPCQNPVWTTIVAAVGGFVVGGALMCAIGAIRRKSQAPTDVESPIRSRKETSFSGLQASSECGPYDTQRITPDVLAQTPESKRVHLCRAPAASRQRHMAGHGGYQPQHAADSMHDDVSRVGESTIVMKDASWNAKVLLHDDTD